MKQFEIAKAWRVAEALYEANMYDGMPASGVHLLQTQHPLLLSAPHATNHVRDGASKLADRWTGGLARRLSEELGSSHLIASEVYSDWQAWAAREDPFALALKGAKAALLIDFHGMANSHGVDIAVGLGPLPDAISLKAVEDLIRLMPGYEVSAQTRFNARSPLTVTSYTQQELKISAFQLEIRAGLRNPVDESERASIFYAHLLEALKSITRGFTALAHP